MDTRILDTTQNLIDIQEVVSQADVTTYQNNLTGVGTDVTPTHLYNYVRYAPTTADVNPSTNSSYTQAEITVYENAIPTSGGVTFAAVKAEFSAALTDTSLVTAQQASTQIIVPMLISD